MIKLVLGDSFLFALFLLLNTLKRCDFCYLSPLFNCETVASVHKTRRMTIHTKTEKANLRIIMNTYFLLGDRERKPQELVDKEVKEARRKTKH